MEKQSMIWLSLLVFAFTGSLPAQNLVWSHTYGGAWQDGAFSIARTQDGGLILTGFNSSLNTNHTNDVLLLKTDASGNQLWMQTFGAALNDRGRCVRQTSDGGFIIGGMTEPSPQLFHALLVRTDSIGNILWQRTFDLGDDTRVHSVRQTSDGGFILAGQAWLGSPTFGSYDMYLVKTDAAGNVQWQRTFEYNDNFSPGADVALSVQQLPDHGYIIGGTTNSSVWASYLIRTDSLGTPVWSRVYDTLSVNECTDVIATSDGGFLLVGGRVDFNTDVDVLLIKIDAGGNPVWQRTYGGTNSDQANSVRQLPDGGFVIAGQTGSFGAGQFDVYVLRTNAAGDTLWTRTFGGPNDDRGFSVEVVSDGVVVGGWAWSFGGGQGDAYLLKLQDPVLDVQDSHALPQSARLYQNYPNPFNPSTRIPFSVRGSGFVSLKVYDVLGREVATLVNDNLQPGTYEVTWDATHQTSGVYFYQLKTDGVVATKRMAMVR